MKKELILILGGAGSGKSAFAQRLAQQKAEKVLFVATAEAKDSEMTMRIRRHRRRRPGQWYTVEEPLELARAIGEAASHQVVVIDCLTLWVSNLLQANEAQEPAEQEAAVLAAARRLVDTCEKGETTLIMVSNEVGMGLVPPYPLGRLYRDVLGRVNQLLAARASRVYLMVAGLAVELMSLGARSALGSHDRPTLPDDPA